MPRQVPCGRCIGCRLERSRNWAIRCVHEAQGHEDNSFITLTYRDEELIYGGAAHGILYPRHLELFWKRFRKRAGKKLRYFACGEYGDISHRPHYHAIVFGYRFPDEQISATKNGSIYRRSNMLDDVWSHGNCIIGDVTFESAAYVARYIMKKRLGESAKEYERDGIEPEFVRMSRRPGIGSDWFDKFQGDVFPHDFVVVRNGVKCKPPRYYFNKYDLSHPLTAEDIRNARLDSRALKWRDNTPARIGTRYRIKMAQSKLLIRPL